MNRLLIFVAGAVAGYIASGWIEGFCGKKSRTAGASGPTSELENQEA
jgi:hypothetical protein